MTCLKLDSNDLFLRYGGSEKVLVFKLNAPHSALVKADDWDHQYTVGRNTNQCRYQSLKIFGHEIKGDDLKKLASDLHQSRLLINREGYCYLESEIVDTSTSTAKSFNQVEYYRINDLFGWSEYRVTENERTTVWDRYDLKHGHPIVKLSSFKDEYEKKFKDLQGELDETKRKLEAKEKEVVALKAAAASNRGSSNVSQPRVPSPHGHKYPFPVEESSQIHRSCQKMKPGHYVFEVRSYTELKKSLEEADCIEFESPEFNEGDFKWVLCLYLRGNPHADDGDDEYISMSLKKHGDPLRRSENIKLLARFFIWNHKHKEYVTVQDSEVTEFDDQMNKESCITQAMSITDFEDKKNGFLKGETCRFGVEFMLVKTSPKTAALYLDDNLEHRIGQCDFVSFSKLPKRSPTTSTDHFEIDTYKWTVQIYPRGRGAQEGKSLSVFLQLVDKSQVSNGEHLFVDFELRLKDKTTDDEDAEKNHSHRRVAWFTETKSIHGFEEFISLKKLKLPDSTFLQYDTVTIEVYINKLFKLKDI